VTNEKNHKTSKLYMIYIASNNVRHPVTKSLNIICSSSFKLSPCCSNDKWSSGYSPGVWVL